MGRTTCWSWGHWCFGSGSGISADAPIQPLCPGFSWEKSVVEKQGLLRLGVQPSLIIKPPATTVKTMVGALVIHFLHLKLHLHLPPRM